VALQRQALRLHDCSLIGAALGALEVNTIAAMYAEVQHSNDLINLIHPQGFRRPVKISTIVIPLGLAQIFPEISRDLTLWAVFTIGVFRHHLALRTPRAHMLTCRACIIL